MPETLSLILDASRRWARRHLNRESFLDGLKTFVWVAPLTVLIWVYAEQEQEKDEPTVQVPIAIKSTDPNRIVTLAPGNDQWITVDLRGPRSKIEAVKSELAKGGDRGAIPIELPGN